MLKLPYISEIVSDEIRKFIRNRDLPVNVIFKPGVKLQELCCSSRPHDKRKCTLADCKICPNLPDGCDCTVEYNGEAAELYIIVSVNYMRFANNPIAPSYKEEAMAVHYRQKHLGGTAKLKFELIKKYSSKKNI